MQTKKVGLICGIVVLIAITFTACATQEDRNINMVRTGTMNRYPNVPIGKAFKQFFSNGKWTAFTSTKDEQIVEFTGNCYWLDVSVPMKIQFTIADNDSFSLSYLGVDGVDMDSEVRVEILYGILEKYQP